MIDMIDGGMLDMTFWRRGVDEKKRTYPVAAVPTSGGFIDISQNAKTVIFMGISP